MLYIINTTSLTEIAYVCVYGYAAATQKHFLHISSNVRVCLLSHNARAHDTNKYIYTKHTPNNLIKLFQSSIQLRLVRARTRVYIYICFGTIDKRHFFGMFPVYNNIQHARAHTHTNKYTHRLTTKDFAFQENKKKTRA